ncbi:MAG: carboxypeptidase regulatory-like domain-containing protein [Gemmatimonadales bacterium]
MTTKLVRATLSLGLAAFVLLIAAGTGWTQVTTGDIRGRVLDTGQQPIEGVQISVTDTRTNTTTGTITNADGRYTVRFLRPGGPFTVTAQSIGYRTVSRTGVAVTLSQAASVDFQLETSAVEVAPLTVAVAGTDAVISKTHTGAQTTVGQKEITDFPTFERQLNEYAILSPYSNVVEGQPSIAGQNNRYNNIQIDGAVNNDVFGLADSGVPGGQARAKPISLLAVEEIQILVSPFDVRQGYFSGGLLNAVTKSGGDTWKGSAFGQGSNNSLVVPFEGTSLGDFDDTQFGAELGGPIIPGKLFFYGAGEGQITTSPTDEGVNLGTSTTPDPEFGFSPAEATEFAAIMEQVYGVDAGTTATISLDNPRTNIFARFDIYPSDKHRIVARWNYSRARDVLPPFRESFSYATSSNIAPFLSNTNSVVLNWFGNFSEKWNNELLINFETVRDNRDPDVDWGQVEVDVTNNTLVAGAERFSQVNLLNQDVFQLTDNVTGIFGSHEITFGTSNQFWSFTNDFQPASIGVWTFDSLDDLAANNPSSYVRRVPLLGASPEDLVSEFSAYQLGFYFQDGWTVSDAFTLNYGLRVDIPILPDKPFTNPDFEDEFGFPNSEVPSGNPLWQPRVGFNWQSDADNITQIRGGAGIFAGRAPYVWISNAYGNAGQVADLTCSGDLAPGFDPSGPGPTSCAGAGGSVGAVARMNVLDPDLKFPTDFKATFGLDQAFGGFVGSVELLYTYAINSIFFEEINLIPSNGTDPVDGRPTFGTPDAAGCGSRGQCFVDNRLVPETAGFAQTVNLTNRSGDNALVLVFGLTRNFSQWLAFRGSYTFSDVNDQQGLFSSQATSNYGRNPIGDDPNDPARTTSSFERRHKAVISATGEWEFGSGFLFQVTPQYFGQSGSPISYVTRGDPNGDGYRDPVISRDNDLIYVPMNVNEFTWDSPEDAANYAGFIAANECVAEQAGSIMARNSCRAPWANRFDMRILFGIPLGQNAGGALSRLDIYLDVTNLFNSAFREPSNIDRGLEVLRVAGRANDDPNGPLVLEYRGPSADSDYSFLDVRTNASATAWQVGARWTFF